MKYVVIVRLMWNGTKEWSVEVNGQEERAFYEMDNDTIETAYGWAEAQGYEYTDTLLDY